MSKESKEFISNEGYGAGTNFTINTVSELMEKYANQRVTEVHDGLTREIHKLVLRVKELEAEIKEAKGKICPECGNPNPHLYTDGTFLCEECGHAWNNSI